MAPAVVALSAPPGGVPVASEAPAAVAAAAASIPASRQQKGNIVVCGIFVVPVKYCYVAFPGGPTVSRVKVEVEIIGSQEVLSYCRQVSTLTLNLKRESLG